MRLHHLRQEGALWRGWGETDVLELSCTAPGVLRLRLAAHAHLSSLRFPGLPEKTSFMTVPGPPAPLPLTRQDDAAQDNATQAGPWRFAGEGICASIDPVSGRVQVWAGAMQDGAALAEVLAWDAGPDPLRRRTVHLHAPPACSYLGFGQKVGPLDKRGLHLTFWNTDCYPHHIDTDPMHLSVPFTVVLAPDGQAHGLFLDESWRSEADVARRDPHRLALASAGPELDLYVLAGPTIQDVLRRYADLTGYAPLPPLWALGAGQSRWGYKADADVRALLAAYREHELPLDSVYLDIDYMDAYKVWTWDPHRFPQVSALVQEMKAAGVHLLPIVDPGVKAEAGYDVYEQGLAGDHFVRTARGEVLLGEVWPDPAAFPDFSREAVRAWWGGLHRRFAEVGIHGQWNDMNEPSNFSLRGPATTLGPEGFAAAQRQTEGKTLPYDARHGTRSHLEVHNVYANGMAEASRAGYAEHAPDVRPFILTRAGAAGIQRSAAVWTGDNASRWSHLHLSLPMLMGLGLSGIPFSAPDVGGFDLDTTGELLARWYQVAVGYAFLRNHATNFVASQEPWRFGEPYLGVIRDALQLRYRLLPHLYTLAYHATLSALPPLRPLALHFPADLQARQDSSAYLLGEGLLVAPVLSANTAQRTVYLPGEGEQWAEAFNLSGFGATHPGGGTVTARAPLDTLPLYLRAGHAVPTTLPALHTTHARWDVLTWLGHVGPGGLQGELYEDDGDGHGPHRRTQLLGTRADKRLTLRREESGTLPRTPREERVQLVGLPGVSAVDGAQAWRLEGGVLHLTLPAGWSEVSVTQG